MRTATWTSSSTWGRCCSLPTDPVADATKAIHAAREADGHSGLPGRPVVDPIVQSANFGLSAAVVDDLRSTGGRRSYSYTRLGNPTNEAAARVVAALEGAEQGVVVASGMAAIMASVTALLPPGGRLLAADELYGDAAHVFERQLARTGYRVSRAPLAALSAPDGPDLGEADVVYVETLSNPMLRVADIGQIAARARRAGARLVVDDTFTTPINAKPLALGADLVVSSATKYLNGHSDVVAGAVAGPADLVESVRSVVSATGCSADPFASFLLLRGLKTLPIRMRRHNETALWLARELEKRPDLELVAYPLLEAHPDHAIARRLLAGGGGNVTIRVAGGDAAAHRLQEALRLIQPATSLGGVESLVCIPAETSHLTLTDDERFALGIRPGTLRFSFGLEDPDDLLADLAAALSRREA
jgi:cystathionine beta-lyase/cystathionine gamma-synthase